MKYKVQGQNITNVYEVKENKDEKGEYIKKPEFVKNSECKWEDILSFECNDLQYNAERKVSNLFKISFGQLPQINIDETKSVGIEKQIFRADEAVMYLFSDEVLSEKDDKETNYQQYVDEVNSYIAFIFEKYPEVKKHCEIYNISDESAFENIDKIKDEVVKETNASVYIRKNMSPYDFFIS